MELFFLSIWKCCFPKFDFFSPIPKKSSITENIEATRSENILQKNVSTSKELKKKERESHFGSPCDSTEAASQKSRVSTGFNYPDRGRKADAVYFGQRHSYSCTIERRYFRRQLQGGYSEDVEYFHTWVPWRGPRIRDHSGVGQGSHRRLKPPPPSRFPRSVFFSLHIYLFPFQWTGWPETRSSEENKFNFKSMALISTSNVPKTSPNA